MSTPSREFMASALRNLFMKLNRDDDPEKIDWEAWVDAALSLEENVDIFERNYPSYRWRGEPQVSIREKIVDELVKIVEPARREGISDQMIKNALKEVEARLGVKLTEVVQRGVSKEKYTQALREVERLKFRLEAEKPPPPPPAPLSPEQAMIEELNRHIRARAIQERLSDQDILFLTTIIDPKRSLEENRRRINDQIESLKMTRPPPPPPERRPVKVPVVAPPLYAPPPRKYSFEDILGGVAYPSAVVLIITVGPGDVEKSGVLALSTAIRYAREYVKKGWKVEFAPV